MITLILLCWTIVGFVYGANILNRERPLYFLEFLLMLPAFIIMFIVICCIGFVMMFKNDKPKRV